jgi:N utilization substance protein B
LASRHRSRELAVQLCYQWDIDPKSLQDPRVTDRFWRNQAQASAENWNFFEILVKGVAAHLPYIDSIIESVLDNWKIDRIEKVDLAVLRVAVFELVYDPALEKTDDAVIIDEAIELSKVFGNQGSPSFVNGILDAIAKNAALRTGQIPKKEAFTRAASLREREVSTRNETLAASSPSDSSLPLLRNGENEGLPRRAFKIPVLKNKAKDTGEGPKGRS